MAKTLCLGPDLPPDPKDHPGVPLTCVRCRGRGGCWPTPVAPGAAVVLDPGELESKGSSRRGGGAACASPSAPRRGGS